MSWAVVYTRKGNTETYLERFTYSEESAQKLVKELNATTTDDKVYRVKLCERFANN